MAVAVWTQRVRRKHVAVAVVYEVNTWLWQFERGKQRLGGLSVDQKEAALQEWSLCCAETRQRSKTDKTPGA